MLSPIEDRIVGEVKALIARALGYVRAIRYLTAVKHPALQQAVSEEIRDRINKLVNLLDKAANQCNAFEQEIEEYASQPCYYGAGHYNEVFEVLKDLVSEVNELCGTNLDPPTNPLEGKTGVLKCYEVLLLCLWFTSC